MGIKVSSLDKMVPGFDAGLVDRIHSSGISYVDVNNLDDLAKVDGVGVNRIASVSMTLNYIENNKKYYDGYGSTNATGFYYRFKKPKGNVYDFNKPVQGGSINRVYHKKNSLLWWVKGYVDGKNLNRALMCDGKVIKSLDDKPVTAISASIVRALYKKEAK